MFIYFNRVRFTTNAIYFRNIIAFLILFSGQLIETSAQQKEMAGLIEENFRFAASQYKLLMATTPPDKMPKTFRGNKLETAGTDWWTSGFFPGSLWLIFEQTGDTLIRNEAEKRLLIQEKMKRYTGNHDIGFMIFCSFGNAYRITGESKYKNVIDTAAEYQLKRYRPEIKSIQSWDKREKFQCPVIIDNMMNLEQLCWVSKNGGDKKFMDIALTHANTTLKNHFRSDHSSFHVVDYNINDGTIIKKATQQGLSDSSAWSRGQAWGLYGFTMMYRFTKKKEYVQQAHKIASFILNHPNLPDDKIPYWDFNAPPGPETKRDASSASIISSALLELAQFSSSKQKKFYLLAAEKMIRSLSSEKYKSRSGENGGFVLMHSVGSLPGNSEVDVPLTYADYYFFEALKRYKDWYLNVNIK